MAETGEPIDLMAVLRDSVNSPPQVEVETAKGRALSALTRATQVMNEANRSPFRATKRRAEKRKEALAAGASVEEVQEAIKSGHRLSSGG